MSSPSAPVTPRRRPQFHPLTVARVDRLTDDAVAVTFDVPDHLATAEAAIVGALTPEELIPTPQRG